MSLEIKNLEQLREIQKILVSLTEKGCKVSQASGTLFYVEIPEAEVKVIKNEPNNRTK